MFLSFLSFGLLAPFLVFDERRAKRLKNNGKTVEVDEDINIIRVNKKFKSAINEKELGKMVIYREKENFLAKTMNATKTTAESYWNYYMSFLHRYFMIHREQFMF